MGDRILTRGDARQGYAGHLARNLEEVKAAQRLRFEVFNLEMQEGLPQSFSLGLDVDPFDAVCDHLVVEELQTGRIVGTYRFQTGLKALENRGYYSAQEFDLSPFDKVRSEVIELGRACVHAQHRNLAVLGFLWRGIADYARQKGGRYLIGCSSLSSQDPTVGASAYEEMKDRHLVEPAFRVQPLPQTACPMDQKSANPPKIPKLLGAYLSIGAKICGPPAIDREFKTIDFLTLIDLASLPPQTIKRYLS